MCRKKWDERMYEKKWEEMQKYKEFDMKNFKDVARFSKIFNRIFNFIKFSILGIATLGFVLALLIYVIYIINMSG